MCHLPLSLTRMALYFMLCHAGGYRADAPCSATGVIRRHPDIKLTRQPDDIAALAVLQGELLDALFGHRLGAATVDVVRAAVGWSSPAGRRQYLPVRLDEGPDGTWVRPSRRRGSGSHLVASLHLADALAVVPAERSVVEAGEPVTLMEF